METKAKVLLEQREVDGNIQYVAPVKTKKKKSQIKWYCKCEHCKSFFEIKSKGRDYCTDSCKMKAYYIRKNK